MAKKKKKHAGDRSVTVGGNLSSSTIITGDGNTVISGNENTVSQAIPAPAAENEQAAARKIKILFLGANPLGTTKLRLDAEIRDIDEGLRLSRCRERFELVQRWAVRVEDLRRALLDENPQIVHFSGHGMRGTRDAGAPALARDIEQIEKETRESWIYLEDRSGKPHPVSEVALSGLFEIFQDEIQCVVLNACFSEGQATAISRHIPYVVGMLKAIGDPAAIAFSTGFYDGLGGGLDYPKAFALGCNAIQLHNIPEHLTPILKNS